ncbi:hypothetical protein BH11ACT8_BH11ACT8_04420 [soil metagenome]
MSAATTSQSARIITTPAPRTNKRAPIEHLFWCVDLAFTREVDVEIKTLCGLWRRNGGGAAKDAPMDVVPIIGGLIPLTEPRDCMRCAKAYAKRARDNWTRRQKTGQ